MTEHQMALALNALAEISLKLDVTNQWYVSQRVEIGNGSTLSSECGRGATPTEAIAKHWRLMTQLRDTQYIVLNAFSDERRHVRWNGFMWTDLPVKKKAVAS